MSVAPKIDKKPKFEQVLRSTAANGRLIFDFVNTFHSHQFQIPVDTEKKNGKQIYGGGKIVEMVFTMWLRWLSDDDATDNANKFTMKMPRCCVGRRYECQCSARFLDKILSELVLAWCESHTKISSLARNFEENSCKLTYYQFHTRIVWVGTANV